MVFANLTETAITLKKGETLCALSVINLCEYEIGSVQTDGEGHGREKCVEHLGSVISCEEAKHKIDTAVPGLAIDLSGLSEAQCSRVAALVLEYAHIFSLVCAPAAATGVEHEIVTGDAQPVNVPPGRQPPKDRELI